MKKVIITLICAAGIHGIMHAGNPVNPTIAATPQLSVSGDTKSNQAGGGLTEESTSFLNIGVGFSGSNTYYKGKGVGYSSRKTPLFSLSYERTLGSMVGPGYLGVGAYMGFENTRYRYDNQPWKGNLYYYEHNWNHYNVAARGTYHWAPLVAERAEIYGGVLLGVRISSYTYTTNSPDPEFGSYYQLNEKSINPISTLFVGARWFWSERMGLFGEAGSGYGLSFAQAGLSFKF